MNPIFLAFLVMATVVIQTSAECCGAPWNILHVCAGVPHENHYYFPSFPEGDYLLKKDSDAYKDKCYSRICPDTKLLVSSILGTYCGVGDCNFFGCNCDGGCRTGKDEIEVIKWFAEKFEFTLVGKPNSVVKFDDAYILDNYK